MNPFRFSALVAAAFLSGAELRDKDGKVIPTDPDAYNVDSALPKKK